MNKKAQGLSTNAIILIVLGVVVLVVLAIGFLAGWDKIAPWIKTTNNVDTIVNACNMACSTNSVYDYCTIERELIDEKKNKIKATCYVFSIVNDLGKYSIQECSLDCKKNILCEDWQYLKNGVKTDVEVIWGSEDKTKDYCSS